MGENTKVVILAGGLGTRMQEETSVKPKPMVDIGEKPILWHIMKIYSARGFREFVIALGYKGDWIKKYFLNYHQLDHDLTVYTKDGRIDTHEGTFEDWIVHLVDSGVEPQTGGRLKRLKKWVGDKTFMMTYGDGVADVDVREVLNFHRKHGKLVTVTAVRPEARFGGICLDGHAVTQFVEKPQIGEGWINGGFFVLEPGALDYIEGDSTRFEREPMERLVADGQVCAYLHDGFWQPMDTMRDVGMLNALWSKGTAPWKVW